MRYVASLHVTPIVGPIRLNNIIVDVGISRNLDRFPRYIINLPVLTLKRNPLRSKLYIRILKERNKEASMNSNKKWE